MASLAYLLLLPIILLFELRAPQELPVPLLLCLSMGQAGAWLERWERRRADVLAEAAALWNADGDKGLAPERVIARSLSAQAASRFLLYLACYSCVYALVSLCRAWDALPCIPLVTWPVMYGIGLMGAVLSLRTRRAYVALACALGGAILFHL